MKALLATSILVLTMLAGCNAPEKIDSAAEKLRAGMVDFSKNIAKASDTLDPVGIKELFRDYKDLETLNRKLEAHVKRMSEGQRIDAYLVLYSTVEDVDFVCVLNPSEKPLHDYENRRLTKVKLVGSIREPLNKLLGYSPETACRKIVALQEMTMKTGQNTIRVTVGPKANVLSGGNRDDVCADVVVKTRDGYATVASYSWKTADFPPGSRQSSKNLTFYTWGVAPSDSKPRIPDNSR